MIYYFDNCATTKVDDEALKILQDFHSQNYFNPSAMNSHSGKVLQEMKNAREIVAKCLDAAAEEIYFTSGGTESNNIAIFGCLKSKTGNIVVCATEHSSVFNSVMQLKNRGFEVRIANAKADGSIDEQHFESLVDSQTLLAIMMHVNNETGAKNDVAALSKKVKAANKNTVVFCDGVQAVGKIPVALHKMDVDLYSFSGHKIHCSKGIGGLYVKKGTNVSPLMFGGGQQGNLRSGTEYVGGIVALAHCVKTAVELRQQNCQKFSKFRQQVLKTCEEIGGFVEICPKNSVNGVLCGAFQNIKSEVLVRMLEQYEIVIGTGSACSAKNHTHRIPTAIGLNQKYVEGVIRISFSKYNDQNQVDFLCEKLKLCVSELGKMQNKKTTAKR